MYVKKMLQQWIYVCNLRIEYIFCSISGSQCQYGLKLASTDTEQNLMIIVKNWLENTNTGTLDV